MAMPSWQDATMTGQIPGRTSTQISFPSCQWRGVLRKYLQAKTKQSKYALGAATQSCRRPWVENTWTRKGQVEYYDTVTAHCRPGRDESDAIGSGLNAMHRLYEQPENCQLAKCKGL
jgi:hypothetical protein